MTDLKLFVCLDHAGHRPVGVASIVLAHTEYEARKLLAAELLARDLMSKQFTLKKIDTSWPQAVILQDGDY
jgi:hypothetical protein